ncbi:MAG: hypothetical protein AAFU67_12820 [Bacteroidota bacterium]
MTSKVNDPQQQKTLWLIKAPLGLSIFGFGVCLVSEAAMLKYGGANTWDWVLNGTLALIVLNAGLCVFGDAVKHRAHFERSK